MGINNYKIMLTLETEKRNQGPGAQDSTPIVRSKDIDFVQQQCPVESC